MSEIVKETVTTRESNPSVKTSGEKEVSSSKTVERSIYFIFGIIEVLLVFRLIFKLVGASHGSYFVDLIYTLTGIFIMPFAGIFRQAVGTGVETSAILEPATLVAIVVYVILAWGIVSLVGILSGEKQTA